MRKLLVIIALVSAAAIANAQDMMSKRGTPILPEANDWSIGISANSTLEYFGNLLGDNFNDAPSFDWTNSDQMITGKMMKDENTAYRLAVRLHFGSSSDETGDTATGALAKTKESGMDINLGAGIQKYRGKGRLKGFYGAEAMIGLGSGKTTYEYNGTPADGTLLESKDGSTFGFGVRGFIGVEYFFAPKMSVSGEFGWGIGLSSTGASENTYQGPTGTVKGGKSSDFGLDTDNAGGLIVMSFYF